MAVDVFASQPEKLLAAIRQEIAGGHIRAWTCDDDGDFTHARTQWQKRAWFRPHVLHNQLRFAILAPTDRSLSVELYAIYHARFIEMLLAHFDELIERVSASALPELGDDVG
ncbi:MAG: hypothetical protein JOZ77_07880 [Candidatus Eremiobacteraeota bacterium]|nr:hypothetical protein [Candidatus Eremiobacteraeota bacterium]